jgi:predicted NBD/HSP70 family sugar kinase
MKVLVIDVGGTNVKILATGQTEVRKIPSSPTLSPQEMVEGVREAAKDWDYEAVSIGYPGPVVHGHPAFEPHNLGTGWVGFDFSAALSRPVRVMNDAAMQALGSYEGGRMLFLGLGTGLGSALVMEKVVAPLELAHMPYRKGRTYEDYLGKRGLDRLGRKKWQKHVEQVVALFQAAFVTHNVVIGGGNSKKLKHLPPGARLGNNTHAFQGGFRMWEDYVTSG